MRLRDELSASKMKVDRLEDDLAKQAAKANQAIARLKAELENTKADRDVAVKEKRELDEKILEQTSKSQHTISAEEAKSSELQRVCALRFQC